MLCQCEILVRTNLNGSSVSTYCMLPHGHAGNCSPLETTTIEEIDNLVTKLLERKNILMGRKIGG